MEFLRLVNVQGRCLPDRQPQDVDLDDIKIFLSYENENGEPL